MAERAADWVDRAFTGPRAWIAVAAAVALSVLTVSPVLGSVFYGDDARRSFRVAAYFARTGQSLLGSMIQGQADWITMHGRLFPLSAYADVVLYLSNTNPFVYKTFIIALIVADLLLFRALVIRLTSSRALGLLAILLPPLMFQVRYADDPITSYHGLLQIVTLLTLAGLLWFLRYIDSGRRGYLAAALAAYAASLLTYEVGLGFFILFTLVAMVYPERRRLRDAVRLTWPFAALAALVVCVAIGLRLAYGLPLTGGADASAYTPNLDLAAIAGTYVQQTTSALPLSYWASYVFRDALQRTWLPYAPPLPGFVGTAAAYPLVALVLAAGYGGLLVITCLRAIHEQRSHSKEQPSAVRLSPLVVVGAGLALLPGVLIALSPKYQQPRWVHWGTGYLPVYVACFGVAALAAACLYRLLGRTRDSRWGLAVCCAAAVAAAFLGVVDFGNTASVLTGWKSYYVYPRAIEEKALRSGLMSTFTDGSALMTEGRDWEGIEFFAVRADRVPSVIGPVGTMSPDVASFASTSTPGADGTTYGFGAGRALYGLRFKGQEDGSGYAVFGRLETVTAGSDGGIVAVDWTPTAIYLDWTGTDELTLLRSYSELTGFDPSGTAWQRTETGPTSALYRFEGSPALTP